jgi:hypothetical protein
VSQSLLDNGDSGMWDDMGQTAEDDDRLLDEADQVSPLHQY